MTRGARGRPAQEMVCSPDGAYGSRECAPDDKLREIRDSRKRRPRIALGSIRGYSRLICPLSSLISDFPKNISVPTYPKSHLQLSHPTPPEGRIMIVTDAGRGAVDRGKCWACDASAGRIALRERLAACKTTALLADGEVVWS